MRLSPAPPAFRAGLAALAQLVEHIIRNDGVVSSSLTSGTILPPFIVYFQIHMTETGADTHPSIHLVFSIEKPAPANRDGLLPAIEGNVRFRRPVTDAAPPGAPSKCR